MGLRPNACYRRLKKPYTRVSHRVPRKSYVTGVPGKKISQFEMGLKGGAFDYLVQLIAKSSGNVRHNALEASRIVAGRHLQKTGLANYFLQIKKYPHHVLRENPLATGAGADRFQEGMSRAFGKPYGVAAIVRTGDVIMEVRTSKKHVPSVKDALKRASNKMGVTTKIIITKTEKPLVTGPTKLIGVKETVVEEKPVEEKKEEIEEKEEEKEEIETPAEEKEKPEKKEEEKKPESKK